MYYYNITRLVFLHSFRITFWLGKYNALTYINGFLYYEMVYNFYLMHSLFCIYFLLEVKRIKSLLINHKINSYTKFVSPSWKLLTFYLNCIHSFCIGITWKINIFYVMEINFNALFSCINFYVLSYTNKCFCSINCYVYIFTENRATCYEDYGFIF